MKRTSTMTGIAQLILGKSAPVVVNLLFIPYFNREFSSLDFGIVSTVFALQGLFALLDFGASTIMLRMVSSSSSTGAQIYKSLRVIELSLLSGYSVVLMAAFAAFIFFGYQAQTLWMAAIVIVIFLQIALQGVYFNVHVATGKLGLASAYQSFSTLGRGLAGYFSIQLFGPDLIVFFFSQLIVNSAIFIISRSSVLSLINIYGERWFIPSVADVKAVFSGGGSLMIISIAGAAVLQLDKGFISMFYGPESLGSYYLATIYCITPLSIIATPVYQYFQPRIIRANHHELSSQRDVSRQFALYLTAGIGVAIYLLLAYKVEILSLWLRNADNVSEVGRYINVLLPAYSIASFGFLPYALVVSQRDFSFHAAFTSIFAIITLILVLALAYSRAEIIFICYVYFFYNLCTVVVPWIRVLQNDAARVMALAALKPVALFLFLVSSLIFILEV